jgi:type I restriction enzyme S subunit
VTSNVESEVSSGVDQQLITRKAQPPVHLTQGESDSASFFENCLIPNGWKAASVSELGRVVTGGTPRTVVSEFWGGGIPWITPTDIDPSRHQVYPARTISEAGLSQVGELPGGSVLVTCIASIGKNAILRVRGACNQQINAIIPDLNVTTIDFVYYALEYAVPRLRLMAGTTATPMVSKKSFLTLQIPMPIDLSEQAAIAEVLSDTDLLLESLDNLITKKRAIKQGAMQQLWSKSRSWAEVEVKRVLIDHFCGPSPTCEERNIKGDEWGVLRTTCTTWESGWNWRSHKLLPSSYWGQDARMVRIGDTIITKAGPRHRVGVPSFVDFIPNNILPSGKMIALRPDPAVIEPYFLALALREKSSQHFLNERTTGMAESQVNFENKALLNTPIKIPSLAEQKEITTVSRDLDADIDALVALREKTAQIKTGIMQDLLTGKVRL